MKDLIEREILGLHHFFENWYSAKIDNTLTEFNRLDLVLNGNFQLISPSGSKIDKSQLLELIKMEYGKFKDSEIFSITIEDIDCRFIGNDMTLVTYTETGNSENGMKQSLITAVFRRNPELINGVEWLHIHET